MLTLSIALQAATLGATAQTVDEPLVVPTGPATLSDEFDTTGVDQSVWRFDTDRNKEGWHNNERQYYADERPANTRIEDGALVIEAHRERLDDRADWGGQDYSSAKLVSRRTFGYGVYEVRAKLPCGRGAWPAIWMVGEGSNWPADGEIDIMEMVGWDATVVHGTLHSSAFNHRLGTQRGAQVTVSDACEVFHSYQLDWSPEAIRVGVDGRAYMRVDNRSGGDRADWPFDHPYNLILNLAIGGDWGGKEGIDDAALPQRMVVDYVRYWEAAEQQKMPEAK